MLKRIVAGVILSLMSVPAHADPKFPDLTGPVVDTAQEIPDDLEATLSSELLEFQKRTGHQVVVVTVPDLQGYEVADFTQRLARHWKIGRKGVNDGVVLLQSAKERKLRIEVGYGLEYALTDGDGWSIINETMVPILKQDKPKTETIPQALMLGARAIMTKVSLTPEDLAELRRKEQLAQKQAHEQFMRGITNFFSFILILVGIAGVSLAIYMFATRKKRAALKAERLLREQQARERQQEQDRLQRALDAQRELQRRKRAAQAQRSRAEMLAAMTPAQRVVYLNNERQTARRIQQAQAEADARRARLVREEEERRQRDAAVATAYSGFSSTDSSSSWGSSSSSDSGSSYSGGGGDFGGGGASGDY